MTLVDYKELYAHEWARREQLHSAANTPISVVTLAGGALLLMAKAFDSTLPALFWSFWISTAVAIGCVVASVAFVIRSLHRYEYVRLPYASDLAAHYEDLKRHYKETGLPEQASGAFEEYLTKRYIEATDANARHNLRRGEYLDRANSCLILALCAIAVAAVPAGIVSKSEPESAEQVEITNLRKDGNELIRAWRAEAAGERCPCGAVERGHADPSASRGAAEHQASPRA